MAKAPRHSRENASELGALRRLYPERWVRTIKRALRETDGYLDDAAAVLGVSRRSLQRWLNEDELLADARKLVAPPHIHKQED